MERNTKGEMLLDPITLAREAAGNNYSRYNGGWVKHVKVLDKSKTDGYSLVGPFLNEGLQWLPAGVYLDCSIAGSRKHPRRHYTIFTLSFEGKVEKVADTVYTRDWAPRLWPAIEKALAQCKPQAPSEALPEEKEENPLAKYDDRELIDELLRRGYDVSTIGKGGD